MQRGLLLLLVPKGGRQLALLSDLHKVIWGICGRAANVSENHMRLLFLVCFLNSLQRGVRLLVEMCFRCDYRDILEASCAVWVPTLGSWCLLCFQRTQDTETGKKVIVAPTVSLFTECFWRSEVQCNYGNRCTLLAINMMQCSNLQNIWPSARLCNGRRIW